MKFLRSQSLAFLLCLPVLASANCKINSFEIPVTMAGSQPLTTATINGSEVKFVVDSGAFYSSISPAVADRLKLVRRPAAWGLEVHGVGGTADISSTRVQHFLLNKFDFPDIEFLVIGHDTNGEAVGLLGQNFLGVGDVEYDLAHGVIRLVRPNPDCYDVNMAYWAGSTPVVELDLEHRLGGKQPGAVAEVNGQRMHVLFDTGGSTSLMSLRAAQRAGLSADGAGVARAGPVSGVGNHEVPTWIGPVASFVLGAEKIVNTHLRFGNIGVSEIDMVLGVDFLLAHRVYVANSQDKIYFTYNGGPAFDLSRHGEAAAAAASAGKASDAQDEAPKDAAGYARRGAAHASRQEFALALVDFNQACERDPQKAAYFMQRGVVQLALDHAALAATDFDTALRLDPNDIFARMNRASLHFGLKHDIAEVLADLAVVDRVLSPQDGQRYQLGELYEAIGRPDLSVPQYDQWIAAHAEEELSLSRVLNSRCYARALWGKELDQALRDCDRSLQLRPDSSPTLDSRGLVHLRRGETALALADYNAALRLDPKLAWSLYGRGLVHLRQGQAFAAQRDLAAAKALRPTIEEEARRYGIGSDELASR